MKIAVLNKIKTESVHRCTGKHWDQWISILNKAGASYWIRKDITEYLKTKHKLKPWWVQLVTSCYEVHIGRRQEGRNLKGEYAVTVTKTFYISQKKMWNFLNSLNGLKTWLDTMSPFMLKEKEQFEVYGGIFGEVRTMKKPERVRLTWQDAEDLKKTVVQLYIVPRPGEKCIVAIQHDKIPNASSKEKLLRRWKSVLNEIQKAVGPNEI